MQFTEAEFTNLITACNTAKVRDCSPDWQAVLNALADRLREARSAQQQ